MKNLTNKIKSNQIVDPTINSISSVISVVRDDEASEQEILDFMNKKNISLADVGNRVDELIKIKNRIKLTFETLEESKKYRKENVNTGKSWYDAKTELYCLYQY